ncbi:hypothetical protein EB72_19795 [Mycobacterium sp. SWH-M1]|nr:hypothetical protein EB72_19795 [Mycobacterium sp. SWH-M1]
MSTAIQPVIAHGVVSGMVIRRSVSETPWRVQSVTKHRAKLDRVLLAGEGGQLADLHISTWIQRLFER